MATTEAPTFGTIDGESVPESGPTLPVIDPSTEAVLADVPVSSAATVDRAVRAAERAFDGWS